MRKLPFIGFNKEWALKAGKAEFIKTFENVYPDHDLNEEWDKISPPKAGKPDSKDSDKGHESHKSDKK